MRWIGKSGPKYRRRRNWQQDLFTKKKWISEKPKRSGKLRRIERWFPPKKSVFLVAQEVKKIASIFEGLRFQVSKNFVKQENWKMIYAKISWNLRQKLQFLLAFVKHSWKHKMLWKSVTFIKQLFDKNTMKWNEKKPIAVTYIFTRKHNLNLSKKKMIWRKCHRWELPKFQLLLGWQSKYLIFMKISWK